MARAKPRAARSARARPLAVEAPARQIVLEEGREMGEQRNESTPVEAMPISDILAGVIREVRKGIANARDDTMAVDVAIELRQVTR